MTNIKDLKMAAEENKKIMYLAENESEYFLERMREYSIKTRGVNAEEKY
ncbi:MULTISPECIES: hypothetical protein [Bacillus cereus group]|nr:hypothetical protein [Bacillus cereus]